MRKQTKFRNKEKSNKGITLIALVITIIVLLILAGITIAMLMGDNSILGKTKESKIKTEYTTAKEIVDLKLLEIDADYRSQGKEYTIVEIAESMKKDTEITIERYYNKEIALIKNGVEENTVNLDKIVVSVNEYSRYKFLIGKSGNSAKIEGITTKEITETTEKLEFQTIEDFEKELLNNVGQQEAENPEEDETDTIKIDTKLGTSYIIINVKEEDRNYNKYEYIIDETTYESQEPTYTIEKLEPESKHTIKVNAIDEQQNRKESKQITVKTEPRLYLYKNKEEYEELTGGWVPIYKTDYIDTEISETFRVNKLENHMNVYIIGEYNKACSGAAIGIANKIDVSDYKYMCTKTTVQMSEYSASSICQMAMDSGEDLFIYRNGEQDDGEYNFAICYKEPVEMKITRWDISAYYGMMNPAIFVQTSYWQGAKEVEAEIYEVWLEK